MVRGMVRGTAGFVGIASRFVGTPLPTSPHSMIETSWFYGFSSAAYFDKYVLEDFI